MSHYIRDLGKVEEFFNALTKSRMYNSFCFIIKPDLIPTKSQLHHKLNHILSESPILVANILDSKIYLPEAAYLDDLVTIWDHEDPDFDSLLPKINEMRFEYGLNRFLFRIIIAGDYVVLVMDHSLFDGGALVNLGTQLFQDEFRSESNILDPVYQFDPKHQISKPFEEILDFSKFTKGPRLESPKPVFKSGITSYGSPHHFITKTTEIPNLSISLTSQIQNSWIQAFITKIPQFDNGSKYGAGMGVDARGFLPEDENTLYGCYSPGFFQDIDPDVHVVHYSDELRNESKTGGSFQPYLSLFKGEEQIDWLKRFGDGLQNTTERGLLGVTSMGKLKVNGWFVQSTFNLEYLFQINVMRYRDELRLIFTMVDNTVISLEQFQETVEEFIRLL